MAIVDCVLALGLFDGMHSGHKEIILQAKTLSKNENFKLIATTFSDEFYKKNLKTGGYLFNLQQRKSMLMASGADEVVVFPTDDVFLSLSAVAFLDYLVKKYDPKAVVMGSDFSFGYKKSGDTELAKNYFATKKIQFLCVPIVLDCGIKISSSDIKKGLINGDFLKANALLGYEYYISGQVSKGRGDGVKNGVPTANIDIEPLRAKIRDGVYETLTEIEGVRFCSVTNVGIHPTFLDMQHNIETHVLDYKSDLYGKTITIYFLKRLRDIITFQTKEELYLQIEKDIMEVRNDEIWRSRKLSKLF